jgi:hypothetical protein
MEEVVEVVLVEVVVVEVLVVEVVVVGSQITHSLHTDNKDSRLIENSRQLKSLLEISYHLIV